MSSGDKTFCTSCCTSAGDIPLGNEFVEIELHLKKREFSCVILKIIINLL
jgi:hypothetical protein